MPANAEVPRREAGGVAAVARGLGACRGDQPFAVLHRAPTRRRAAASGAKAAGATGVGGLARRPSVAERADRGAAEGDKRQRDRGEQQAAEELEAVVEGRCAELGREARGMWRCASARAASTPLERRHRLDRSCSATTSVS